MERDNIQIVCDNIVTDVEGNLKVVESMFSSTFNLTNDHNEILTRIHPVKKKLYDAISSGALTSVSATSAESGKAVNMKLNRRIEVHVNKPGGGIFIVDYTDLAEKQPQFVAKEIQVKGFDENSDPVIRQMLDGSLRLVFCTMPPRKNRLGKSFDIEAFGKRLQQNVKAQLEWDDRDVFYIKSAGSNTIREITDFLQCYGGERKPSWKFW